MGICDHIEEALFFYELYFIDEETEAQRVEAICLPLPFLPLKKKKKDYCDTVCSSSRTFHTYSSDEAHEEEEPDAEEDVRVHAPLNLAALVPRAAVIQHGFCLVACRQT